MKTGRNDLCPCGSGQKYKKCCEAKDQAAQSVDFAAKEAERAAEAAATLADPSQVPEAKSTKGGPNRPVPGAFAPPKSGKRTSSMRKHGI